MSDQDIGHFQLSLAMAQRFSALPCVEAAAPGFPVFGIPIVVDKFMPDNRGLIIGRDGTILKIMVFEGVVDTPAHAKLI